MEWVRGDLLGHGSFGGVNLAKPLKGSYFSSQFPTLMAVKSCANCSSSTLKNEKEVLDQVGICPQIVRCFGDDYSFENGERLYNIFLEYASRGSLADRVKKNNGRLQESDVKKYTRSMLKGLRHVHSKGFVHCDIKLQNVLVFDDDEAKIADFGLAKKSSDDSKQEQSRFECRGTPLYMSPESVNENEYEAPGDIWALGCAVVEMASGKPAWNLKQEPNVFALLIRIGVGDELPNIPWEFSEQGKDFLMKCFVKDPKKRWTAEMLLNHPFVCVVDDDDDDDNEVGDVNAIESLKGIEELSQSQGIEELSQSQSPRCPFGFPEWISVQSSVTSSINSPSFDSFFSSRDCLLERIRVLAGDDERPNWSDSENWVTVR